MENNSDNVAEIEKYAFLLGSAIKTEDTEQFFNIYDSILPSDLPDTQLEAIKQKARVVADLPESEFNDLVIRARHFSLAPTGPSTMSYRETAPRSWNKLQTGHNNDSDEDEGVCSALGYPRVGGGKSDTSSMRSATKVSTMSSESDTRRFDDDSGVCNSSKATNSVGSLSDHEGSDYDSRTFDYFPPSVKIRAGCGMNLDYDEAHEVKSEDSSTNDINSPRSDFSDGIEMVNMSSRGNMHEGEDDFMNFQRDMNTHQDDFDTDNESDDGTYQGSGKDYYREGYRPLIRERESNFQPSFRSSQKFLCDVSPSSLRGSDVDSRINIDSLKKGTSHYSRYSDYGSTYQRGSTSDTVRIKTNTYKKDPPFGHGTDHFEKVAHSAGSLISQQPDREVKDMPAGRKLEPLAPEENKKNKKKKKRLSKEDANDTDVNGNPIVEGISLNKSAYLQMRESPSAGSGSVGTSLQPFDGSVRYDLSSSSNKESEDAANKTEHRKRKKAIKDEKVKKSEECENYIGNKTVEEILEIIKGQDVSNKKTKKSSTDDVSKAPKPNKKSKDKKQKSPTPSNSVEEAEVKGVLSTQTVSADLQKGDMGNSSGKGDVNIAVENGETEGRFIKKETKLKASKSLLKDTDKSIPDVYCNNSVISSHPSIAHTTKGPVICRETVKDKDTSRTNNKREAVVDCVVGAEQKKKVDKSPKTTTEQAMLNVADMVASKSEGDNCVANGVSVKQKNAKNKKSKPTSPTVKASNELPGPDIQNHQPLFNSMAGESYLDADFIFTDFPDTPSVPKEDEFQLVGKKKKKQTKEVQQIAYTGNGNSVKPNRRFEDKPRVNNSFYSNSKLPNPHISQTAAIDTDTNACDLSPSSFPALGTGKGRQSIQEGRRNSTGDVPIPSDLKSQDDSDIESVKSLPAIQGSRAGEIVSPRLNMSYAKMAAGSKQAESLSASTNTAAVPGSGDSESDPKKAVWKGSPTERRHSIGSSPEGVNIGSKAVSGASSVCAAASLKAGSQENIKGQVAALETEIVSDAVKIPNAWVAPKEGGPSSGGACGEDAKISIETTSNKLSREEKSVSEGARSGLAASVAATLSHNVSSSIIPNSQPQWTEKQVAKSTSSETKMNSSSYISSVRGTVTNSNSSVQKTEAPKSKAGVATNNNKKVKSVIFLDKRVEEAPSNLGISFGFEMEPIVNKINKTEAANINPSEKGVVINQLNSQSSSASSKPVNALNTCTTDCSEMFAGVESLLKPCQSSSSNSSVINDTVLSNPDTPSDKSSKTDAADATTAAATSAAAATTTTIAVSAKQVSQLTRLNGMVSQPQGQHTASSTGNGKEVHPTEPAAESVAAMGNASEESDTVKAPVVPDGGVLVYYGESVATLKKEVVVASPANGPTRYCGLVVFLEEKEVKSNFNIMEAAGYLTTEWKRHLQFQDRDPSKVHTHVG